MRAAPEDGGTQMLAIRQAVMLGRCPHQAGRTGASTAAGDPGPCTEASHCRRWLLCRWCLLRRLPATGRARSCSLTGKIGVCSAVRDVADDMCGGGRVCDGAGACRQALGAACVGRGDCVSGNCVDGVCCASAECGGCESCSVTGSVGTCVPVAKFSDDPNSGCEGDRTCDGLGFARGKANGSECSSKFSACRFNASTAFAVTAPATAPASAATRRRVREPAFRMHGS